MKEILIYGGIDSYSAGEFIAEINAALEKDPNTEIIVRLNCPGGDVDYAWGEIAKFAELKNTKQVKVDGKAQSMGLYFCCYTDNVEALDVSEFLLHRAAYPDWVESSPDYFTADRKSTLDRMNKKLRAAFEAKVNVPLFEKTLDVKLDDVYSLDGRLDVRFTAQQAKKVGLIKSINTITPQKKAEIDALMEIAAKHTGSPPAPKPENKNENKKIMTIETLKAEHKELFDSIVKDAVKAEHDRVKSYMVFQKIDPEGVKAGIESGEVMSATQLSEFSLKALSPEYLESLKKISAGATTTEEIAKDKEKKDGADKEKKVADFFAEVNANLGLKESAK